MIKRLQRRFVFIAMASLTAVLIVVIALINFANYFQNTENAGKMLEYLSENEGSFPEFAREEKLSGLNPDIPPGKTALTKLRLV